MAGGDTGANGLTKVNTDLMRPMEFFFVCVSISVHVCICVCVLSEPGVQLELLQGEMLFWDFGQTHLQQILETWTQRRRAEIEKVIFLR